MDLTNKRFVFDQIVRMLWADWPSAMPQPSKEPELPQSKSTGGRLHVKRWPLWATISGLSETTNLLFAKLLIEAAWYQKERGRTKHFDGFFGSAQSICEISTHPDRDSVLADIFFCLGRYEEGETDLKEALRIRKSLGNYIPRSGEANLSWALLAQGKLEECNALLLDSLAGREKALGKEDRESVRTGLILYALGNLRAAQKEWGESFEYHRRAWRHMCATVGEKDFYTANVAHKLAEHLNRAGQRDEAIAMINLALQIWSVDQTAHLNEIARTHFLMAKVFEGAGKTQEASVALKVACGLRKEVTKVDRDVQSLRTEDFDEIVGFWAR
ncbi:hypothetical protein ACQRIT_007945 [Beauveria bassiana]